MIGDVAWNEQMLMPSIAGEPYAARYRQWLERRRGAQGYDFGMKATSRAIPTIVADAPLRWYSTDRRRRLLRERAFRDQLLYDILKLRDERSGRRPAEAEPQRAEVIEPPAFTKEPCVARSAA